jgi:hypothetical protein
MFVNYLILNACITRNVCINDPKINRVLPLPQGNHVAKFGKDPIYTKLSCGNDPVVKNSIYSNGDLDL